MKKKADHYNKQFSGVTAEDMLRQILELHGDKAVFSTSLGAEDQVITHMLMQINPEAKIFTLDTGRMFPETYEVIEKTEARYNMRIRVFFPDYKAVEHMVNTRGINLFYYSIENRKLCCHIRKIEPLKRALRGNQVWITGLRREQSPTRLDMRYSEWDEGNSIIKVNPLLDWTEKQVWDYIHQHKIPYNTLHDKGFPSIGCQPCTRAIEAGEDVRAGRWWWENPDSKECGLHKA
ncbi:MAG: phosphoadenylyl-sulfate reductase [Bacteroidales bacterium]|jgi:phosphoadenosine phosphosulfate reductase|nr:phosphoadenylyl-sulfate reductase [Bacteroidales bacterium]NLM92081.1 phosphoadenylyl-sulfate reductase [Bacteroidales bacterium]